MSSISFETPSQRNHGSFKGGALGKVTYSGYLGSFSPFTVQDVNSTLPVELYEFKGQVHNEGVMLSWSTLNEKNNEEFVLYHSTDAKNWEAITRKEGQAYSSQKIDYDYLHRNAILGANYYYLEQKTIGEEAHHLGTIRVMMANSELNKTPRMMPNPWSTGETLFIQWPTTNPEPFRLMIYATDGIHLQSIESSSLVYQNDSQGLFALQNLNLNPGVYMIVFQSQNKRFSLRLLVN